MHPVLFCGLVVVLLISKYSGCWLVRLCLLVLCFLSGRTHFFLCVALGNFNPYFLSQPLVMLKNCSITLRDISQILFSTFKQNHLLKQFIVTWICAYVQVRSCTLNIIIACSKRLIQHNYSVRGVLILTLTSCELSRKNIPTL